MYSLLMIILGIDPGSRKTGFGVIDKIGRSIKYLGSGVLDYSRQGHFFDRFNAFYDSSKELVEHFHPDVIAFESLIYVKNISSLTKLAQARGAMLAAFSKTHQGRIFEYSPTLVKSTVIGHGHSSKKGVEKGVSMLLGISDFKTDDESDALAIAICHGFNEGTNCGASKNKARSLKDVFRNYEEKL